MSERTPQDVNPNIPSTFTSYRPWQWQGIQDVVEHLANDVKVVFVDAPTGSGKTLLAESVRSIHTKTSVPYVCTTKTLQDQILHEFPYAKVLKGRDNYPTRLNPTTFPGQSCGDCDSRVVTINEDRPPEWLQDDLGLYGKERLLRWRKDGSTYVSKCELCGPQPLCPYVVARDEAVTAPLCVVNTAYYLREVNGPGRLDNRELVIVDEADAFADNILDTFSVRVPGWILHWPGCPLPDTASNPEHIEDWINKMIVFVQGINSTIDGVGKRSYIEKWGAKRQRARANSTAQLETNLSIADSDDWLYVGPSSRSRKTYKVAELKPIVIGDWVHEFVWDHSKQWILMSASFVSIELEAMRMGLRPSQIAKVKIDYSFDTALRPIHYWPSTYPYTRASEKAGKPTMANAAKKIETIADWYPDERILVHTVSHERTRKLVAAIDIDRPVFHFDTAFGRDEAIEGYRQTDGAMLFGAGLERGYDFKYDDCRVCIIVKTPFADLSDPIVGTRMRRGKEGQLWFTMIAARATVQMIGRGMRAADDWLITYLLDQSFEDYLRGGKRQFIPPEVSSAVRFGLPVQRTTIDTAKLQQ